MARASYQSRARGPQIAESECSCLLSADLKRIAALSPRDPSDGDLVQAAALLMRYQGHRGEAYGSACNAQLTEVLKRWGLSEELLFERTRAIWARGYRPSLASADVSYGSGADPEVPA